MICMPEGQLRAYLDDELSPARRSALARHLSACARCREALAGLERSAVVAQQRLASVSLAREPDMRLGLAHIRARLRRRGGVQPRGLRRSLMATSRGRLWRPVLGGIIVLALLVGVFSFAPSRALARQFLSIFRVRKFAIIQVNPDEAQLEQVARALEDTLFVTEPEVVVDEPTVKVSSIEEASELAGFQVRMPQYLPADGELEIQVKGRSEFAFDVARDGLVMLLELADMDSEQVPTGWEVATIRVTIPSMVGITVDHFQIGQLLAPTVEYPEGLAPQIVGEAGLRLLGLSPEEAQRISERIDWTNTVLLPIPTDVIEFRELQVAGEEAVLLIPRRQPMPEPVQVDEQGVPLVDPNGATSVLVGTDASAQLTGNESTLLWEKDGVLYFVVGRYGAENLIQIAESMF